MNIQSEQLAYWYLRLNGLLTIPNFVVHPDTGSDQKTEVDVLGVRFPYRAENLENPMEDDDYFATVRDKPFVVIAEVKRTLCDLNGPWTNPERQNMLRVLRAIGTFPESECELVAKALYKHGCYDNELYRVSLLCLGRRSNNEVAKRYPNVRQILWSEVLEFIYRRFHKYENQKELHDQWDESGKELWRTYKQSCDEGQFKEECLRAL